MLDLSKPLGVHENIIFYGDHQQNDVVYYLPNEVGLAPIISDNNSGKKFDFFLEIFKEGIAIKGGLKELEDSSGAIMSLGVQCIASKERLDLVRDILIDKHDLPENFVFSPPEWKNGSIDLIVLDATTQDDATIGEDSFVESIIGSKKPSLTSSDLKAIFNVRLDRKGASLVAATLQGDRSSVAGVLYDLKFKALQPALDLKIEANLDRCHDVVSHIVSVGAKVTYYVTLSAEAKFEFIKEKLIEEGAIKVEVLSQVTNPEMRKMIDDTVKEFKDKVMKELFSPMVNTELPEIDLGLADVLPQVGVAYEFKKKKSFHNKKISIDYRERSATLKTHNPQAHLWLLGEQIKDDIDNYTKTVTFSDLWRENYLETSILHDFETENDDLLSAEVLIWRKKDGKKTLSKEGGFDIPDDAIPLISFTTTKKKQEKHNIAWITESNEEAGYYYQVKFTYEQNLENTSSPVSIFSEVIYSSSQDLIIIPQVLVPLNVFSFRYGNIKKEKITGVDIFIRSKDIDGNQLSQEILSLSDTNKEVIWKLRNHPFYNAYVEEERHFHFADDRPTLKQKSIALLDEELIVSDPFEFKNVKLIPVITGINKEDYLEILLQIDYKSSVDSFEYNQLFRAKSPDFSLEEITIPVLQKGDAVTYKYTAITSDGNLIILEEGETSGGPLILKIEKAIPKNGLRLIWEGNSPEKEDLDYLRLEFKIEKEDGTKEKLEKVEFSGDTIPKPVDYEYDKNNTLLIKITKRYFSGRKVKTKYQKIETNQLTIKP